MRNVNTLEMFYFLSSTIQQDTNPCSTSNNTVLHLKDENNKLTLMAGKIENQKETRISNYITAPNSLVAMAISYQITSILNKQQKGILSKE